MPTPYADFAFDIIPPYENKMLSYAYFTTLLTHCGTLWTFSLFWLSRDSTIRTFWPFFAVTRQYHLEFWIFFYYTVVPFGNGPRFLILTLHYHLYFLFFSVTLQYCLDL